MAKAGIQPLTFKEKIYMQLVDAAQQYLTGDSETVLVMKLAHVVQALSLEDAKKVVEEIDNATG